MLYLIGLGLNVDGISKYGLAMAQKCKRVYLENYTVDFPYSLEELQNVIDKKLIAANREKVEGLSLIDEAKKMDIALLIYGSPLTATTHITLIQEAKNSGIRCKVIYAASVFDAVAETGLQLYKFGKITSMPNFKADSFMQIVQQNLSMKAHSLILIDIGMKLSKALEQLEKAAEEHKVKLDKILVCSQLGTKYLSIYYDNLEELKNLKVKKPFCIIIPSKLHFLEKEVLENK
jgi:diphthine synthase